MSARPSRLGRVLAGTALVLLTACGGGSQDSRAELVDALEAIDDSVTGSDDDLVLQRIDELVERTEDARDAGDISDAEAEQVLAAAEALRAAVLAGAGDEPTPAPTTAPTTEPTSEPTTPSTTGPAPPTSAPTSDEPDEDEDDEDDRPGPGGGRGGPDDKDDKDDREDGRRGPREP